VVERVERQDWLVMNLVVEQVAMCLERMAEVAAEELQAATRDLEVSSWPSLLAAEQLRESV
jgi:hypothetical protein